jgi:hypothetical protein
MLVLCAPDNTVNVGGEEPVPGAADGFIIRLTEPVVDRKLMEMVFADFRFDDKRATHAGKEYVRGWYSFRRLQGEQERHAEWLTDIAVHLANDRTIVFSHSEVVLKKMLAAKAPNSRLIQRLRRLDAGNDLIFAIRSEGVRELTKILAYEFRKELPAGLTRLLKSPALDSATLTVDVSEDPVARLAVEARADDSAAEIKGVMDRELAAGKATFRDEQVNMIKTFPPEKGQWAVELIEEILDGVVVTQDGGNVTATLKRPKALAKLPQVFASMKDRPE